jgi:predicted ribosomally synthesized peptide with nif11-like leader
MSRENLEQFMNQIAGSEELQAKIGEEIDTESLIALGAECGCEFTPEDLLFAAQLSEEELDGVAGGWKIGIKEARRKNPNTRVFNIQQVARCRPHNMFQCARCHPDLYPDGFK